MPALKVLLADDHRLMLAGIRRALELSDTIVVVGEVNVGSRVLSAVAETEPDVVLLDIRMPELDGLACLERLRARHPDVAVVMLSTYGDAERVETARQRGATGYIVKSVNPLELPSLLRQLVDTGEFAVLGLPSQAPEGGTASAGLSERELSVLTAVARGLSNREIGAELWVTEQTVKFHLRNIYRKLGLSSRTEAARYAYANLLAGAEPPTVSSRTRPA